MFSHPIILEFCTQPSKPPKSPTRVLQPFPSLSPPLLSLSLSACYVLSPLVLVSILSHFTPLLRKQYDSIIQFMLEPGFRPSPSSSPSLVIVHSTYHTHHTSASSTTYTQTDPSLPCSPTGCATRAPSRQTLPTRVDLLPIQASYRSC